MGVRLAFLCRTNTICAGPWSSGPALKKTLGTVTGAFGVGPKYILQLNETEFGEQHIVLYVGVFVEVFSTYSVYRELHTSIFSLVRIGEHASRF